MIRNQGNKFKVENLNKAKPVHNNNPLDPNILTPCWHMVLSGNIYAMNVLNIDKNSGRC